MLQKVHERFEIYHFCKCFRIKKKKQNKKKKKKNRVNDPPSPPMFPF